MIVSYYICKICTRSTHTAVETLNRGWEISCESAEQSRSILFRSMTNVCYVRFYYHAYLRYRYFNALKCHGLASSKVCAAAKWCIALPPAFSMNGRGSISICDTDERTVMRNSDCIQMRNFESRNALRLKTAFHSIRWIARIINAVTVVHDIQSAETINLRPFNVVQGCWVGVRGARGMMAASRGSTGTLRQFVTSACRLIPHSAACCFYVELCDVECRIIWRRKGLHLRREETMKNEKQRLYAIRL